MRSHGDGDVELVGPGSVRIGGVRHEFDDPVESVERVN